MGHANHDFLNLAPDIQERILFLPRVKSGRGLVTERELREVSMEVDWGRQRRSFDGIAF